MSNPVVLTWGAEGLVRVMMQALLPLQQPGKTAPRADLRYAHTPAASGLSRNTKPGQES